MTTPKSPEQVVKEFLTDFPATNDSDSKELSMYQRKAMKEYIRSSMSSLLCYMAERMQTDFPTAWKTMVTKKEQHHERCSWRQAGMLCDCAGQDVFVETINHCRSLLIEEAKKIAKDMILNEMQPSEERIRQAATEAAEDQNKMLEEARKITSNK